MFNEARQHPENNYIYIEYLKRIYIYTEKNVYKKKPYIYIFLYIHGKKCT